MRVREEHGAGRQPVHRPGSGRTGLMGSCVSLLVDREQSSGLPRVLPDCAALSRTWLLDTCRARMRRGDLLSAEPPPAPQRASTSPLALQTSSLFFPNRAGWTPGRSLFRVMANTSPSPALSSSSSLPTDLLLRNPAPSSGLWIVPCVRQEVSSSLCPAPGEPFRPCPHPRAGLPSQHRGSLLIMGV